MRTMDQVKVAVVQAGSVIMDKQGCIEKAAKLLLEAGQNGAQLVVFPEAFIPCYPRGMGFGAVVGSRSLEGRKDYQRYWDNAIQVPSADTDALGAAVKEAGVYCVIGVIEKDQDTSEGTVFCTALYFGPDGKLLGKHRKLKPTASERLIWGEGDGSTLKVIETPFGRVGSLICWENYMPLARAAMYAQGVQIYVAPTADSRDTWFATMRHIAIEGRCFVIGCNQYSSKSDYPEDIASRDEFKDLPEEMCRGGSCIVNPLGAFVVEPVIGKETIIYADLDLGQVAQGQFDFDAMGHYSRPDVFQLIVNTKKKTNVIWQD
ncbi:MAG: carbon-nitrogen hydrolase family protein [Selenomonadales bacterium]|nr:carbon-nitrogen hydrolase family protein [Selenomonadales bacterium]MBQ5860052.1 carbon-nitrogen hydrolase family protein [Selenomonadales bacterium]